MMEDAGSRPWRRVRGYLLRGFLVWIPLAAVVLVGRIIYTLVESWFFPSLAWEPRLTALAMVIVVLFATGWVVSRFGVARLILRVAVERPLNQIPVARWIYSGVRQLLESLFAGSEAFGKVVLIEYPRRGLYSIAFQMAGGLGEVQHRVRAQVREGHAPPSTPDQDNSKGEVMAVFVPTTPNPTSGVVITLPKEEVIELQMTRQQALQMIISLGVVVPRWEGKPPSGSPAVAGGQTIP